MMLVDLDSGTYFGLNDVGGRFWQLLDEGQPLGQACNQLQAEFDVERDQLERDIGALVGELVERKLLVPA
ncbi:MAG: PqqD family protein [Novosphingobium sp.]|uniref:PqqD family protein n=1 Tax=Novosphingobium sp. TaxID=1874826 RepID=UPI0032B86C3C